jgi:hypothetical protein
MALRRPCLIALGNRYGAGDASADEDASDEDQGQECHCRHDDELGTLTERSPAEGQPRHGQEPGPRRKHAL